ncbi:MAG: FkbM family methyltransferase [Verrucomicrobiota bacterium]|nr:FkbM family methyltransferase [Limisphaera sp.]MDW8382830.1 FkbM family methyltransferase [Verrucomicrobiota bacterium]
MLLKGKKNPLLLLGQALQCWWSLRDTRAFAWRDAWRGCSQWLCPGRWTHQRAARRLEQLVRVDSVEPGVTRVVVSDLGLTFFWLGAWHANAYHVIAQELEPGHPHHYTTEPIALNRDSLVIDVGACEGLFACRVLRKALAARVVAFEPSARTVRYLIAAAQANGVADRLRVEQFAVAAQSGCVPWMEGDNPEANRIGASRGEPVHATVEATTLDEYCAAHGLQPGPWDLIKVDAEGADLDVLRGAEGILRDGAPQVAVTTYHVESHAREIWSYLRAVQPAYEFRIKGLWLFGPASFWGGARLRPVLLQAAVPLKSRAGWRSKGAAQH